MPTRSVYIAFAVLAILLGPVSGYTLPLLSAAMRSQSLAGVAAASFVAALIVLAVALVRHESLPTSAELAAVLAVLLPQQLAIPLSPPYLHALRWLHASPWGISLLISLAAPLWIALLSALDLIAVEVPRAVVAATIAALGALCLVIPTGAYAIAVDQLPIVLLSLLLALATVYSWAFAVARLSPDRLLVPAACLLLLRAASSIVWSFAFERPEWQTVTWREALLPVGIQAGLSGAITLLTLALLTRMRLASFSMHPLAAWVAAMLPGFALFGFLSWRTDTAILVVCAAVAVALRSRPAGEQPIALGL